MAIELVKQSIFSAVVCSDINPERPDALDRIDEEVKTIDSGIDNPWRALRSDDVDWEKMKPVKCSKYDNKWHYMLIC